MRDRDPTCWIIDEYGAGIAITGTIVAFWLLTRRGGLPQPKLAIRALQGTNA